MLRTFLLASTLAGFGAAATAQCATLTVTGTGAPGTALTLTIDGTGANRLALVAIGETQGTTTIELGPLGTLSLGLEFPFIPVPLGLTNSNGDASLTINVPSQLTSGLDLFGQGITIGFSFTPPGPPSFSLCTTNVVGFHIGV